ncbi:MAG TPA: HK97 family phage prohead protease [bacterium]|nr:HK97 family phage prohead protease [bacterium]HNH33806.1 HK97 family phage prohead protease [bacterium]
MATILSNPTIERRYFDSNFEVRKMDDGKHRVCGYALRFGVSYDMGWFTEEISRTALDNADMTDVRILFNHDPNQILGRTSAGTATVRVDDNGLWYEAELPNSPNGENVRVALERGDVTQSSWGFMLRYDDNTQGDLWQRKNGKDHRTITDVSAVFDASPVTFPANPETSAAKRSYDQVLKHEQKLKSKTAEIDCILALHQ